VADAAGKANEGTGSVSDAFSLFHLLSFDWIRSTYRINPPNPGHFGFEPWPCVVCVPLCMCGGNAVFEQPAGYQVGSTKQPFFLTEWLSFLFVHTCTHTCMYESTPGSLSDPARASKPTKTTLYEVVEAITEYRTSNAALDGHRMETGGPTLAARKRNRTRGVGINAQLHPMSITTSASKAPSASVSAVASPVGHRPGSRHGYVWISWMR
jgi:hypothetical protein